MCDVAQKGAIMAHLFIIAGHGAGDSGAVGYGYTEAERVRALARRIVALGGSNVTLGDVSRNWYADKGISSLNIPKSYQILELHMDSGVSTAKGGHVIIKEGYSPDQYDTALANFIGSFFPGRANKVVGRAHLANVNRAATKVTVIVCWRTDLFPVKQILPNSIPRSTILQEGSSKHSESRL